MTRRIVLIKEEPGGGAEEKELYQRKSQGTNNSLAIEMFVNVKKTFWMCRSVHHYSKNNHMEQSRPTISPSLPHRRVKCSFLFGIHRHTRSPLEVERETEQMRAGCHAAWKWSSAAFTFRRPLPAVARRLLRNQLSTLLSSVSVARSKQNGRSGIKPISKPSMLPGRVKPPPFHMKVRSSVR